MKFQPEFGDPPDDQQTRGAKIRALFTSGESIDETTRKCIEGGVWTDAENAAAAMAFHRSEVRTALRALIDGVPWAGEVNRRLDGTRVWRQLDLWSYDDYAYHLATRVIQIHGDVTVINRLIDRCLMQHGRAPIEKLILSEDA